MAFRRTTSDPDETEWTIPMDELRSGRKPEEHGDTYQASRGWWHKPTDKPVPGTPKKG